ncbi:MAG: insulinase family protein [Bacteroidetes bacterium]|nr:insulinase family protein [Bacteroidota bacterium]MBV6461581.1 hypothetical protein [Flavobacteriales bacterium]WKZ74061.1 MAG: pitrilysin family protein [Vicingaceae bacterium]MCL4817195.1 insulinase family protein [Flavobacteriales bacterium]NOG95850.1 insulinase family protein [Bacteroidota bacterium]
MKNISKVVFLFFLFICTVTSYSQKTTSASKTSALKIDRSKAPAPGAAPKIQIGNYEAFMLDNGLKVIVVENHKLPKISFQLSLDIDPVRQGNAAGLLSATGELLATGTTTRTKEQIDEETDFIGANFSTNSEGFFASALSKHTEKLLDLVSDVILNPAFSAEQLEKINMRTLSGLSTAKTDASAMSANVAKVLRYGKQHPYGEITTEETVKNITVELCKEYYKNYFKPNASYLVIVGDITPSEAKKMVEKYFGKWPKGSVPKNNYETPNIPSLSKVAFVNKPGAVQSVITITYPVEYKVGQEDYIAASVMNSILGGGGFSARLFQNIREDKGYTYGAYSQLSNDPVIGYFSASASVRNGVTDSAIVEFLKEMKRMRDEPVTEKELQSTKNFITGSFARGLEQPQTIARFALQTEKYKLPKDYYATYLEKLNALTVGDIQRVAQKYMKPDNAYILVVGNKDEVAIKLKPFSASGKIEYFDHFGNAVSDSKPLPKEVTAQFVIDNYIRSIGGLKAIHKVKDITTKLEGSVQGMDLQMTVQRKQPNKSLTSITAGVMVIQKQVFDGAKASASGMQGNREITGEELEELRLESQLFLETKYNTLGYQLNLISIEEVNGADAYKVEVISPKGNKTYDYFDMKTGFKVMSVKTKNVPQAGGEITVNSYFSEYKEVKGIKFPHQLSQSMGKQDLKWKVTSVELNTKLKDEIFK